VFWVLCCGDFGVFLYFDFATKMTYKYANNKITYELCSDVLLL
jgi:hypothetical protein